MKFSDAIRKDARTVLTENGQLAHNTTGDKLLDFYSTVGAIRNADKVRKETLYDEAYAEDPLMATKILFYARDVRGGLGERQTFRELLKYASKHHPGSIEPNIPLIAEYGRFDDLYSLIDTPVEKKLWEYVNSQLTIDLNNMDEDKPISLLGKWLKSIDASSTESRRLAYYTADKLGMDPASYKMTLRRLRKYLDIVERHMVRNEWGLINYEGVPSRASMIYRKAFARHDKKRYDSYIFDVNSGKTKINASTLYPYDIVEKYYCGYGFTDNFFKEADDTVEALWKNLPNYVEPGTNAIVIADVSGSMQGRPICSAIGLAIYFAERNTGVYHNLMMSFSSSSTVHEIKGTTLLQKIHSINMRDWGMNTNLEAAFDNILDIAIRGNVKPEDMVKSIVIISDMEIDACCGGFFYDEMRNRYKRYGYELPNVIFWNAYSRHDTFHTDKNRKGVQLASGQSAATFKAIMACVGLTPLEAMYKVIGSERYEAIKVL